jgi:Flp pilus assembly pilin Flp
LKDAVRNLIDFLNNDEGTAAIEYGLLASLIVIAVVGVLVGLGCPIPAIRSHVLRTPGSTSTAFQRTWPIKQRSVTSGEWVQADW